MAKNTTTFRCVVDEPVHEFNILRDIQKVSPDGWIDLRKAHALGSVPADIPMSEEHFNGAENPASIALRPGDIFEEMQAHKVIVGYVPPKSDGDSSEE